MNESFEEISPNTWKTSEVGDSIEGVYIDKREAVGQYNSNAYVLDVVDGGLITVFGNVVIDDRMRFCDIGDTVRITFMGKELSSNNREVKIFKVERRKNA